MSKVLVHYNRVQLYLIYQNWTSCLRIWDPQITQGCLLPFVAGGRWQIANGILDITSVERVITAGSIPSVSNLVVSFNTQGPSQTQDIQVKTLSTANQKLCRAYQVHCIKSRRLSNRYSMLGKSASMLYYSQSTPTNAQRLNPMKQQWFKYKTFIFGICS